MSKHVKIIAAHTQYPSHTYDQGFLSKLLYRYCTQQYKQTSNVTHHKFMKQLFNKIQPIFYSSGIKQRHFIFEPSRLYRDDVEFITTNIATTKLLLLEQCSIAIQNLCKSVNIELHDINCIISTTGIYSVPTFDFDLLSTMKFRPDIQRQHNAGAASGGGARTLIDAYKYCTLNPTHCVLTICAESGSHGWIGAIRRSILDTFKDITIPEKLLRTRILNNIIVSAIMGDGVGVCIVAGKHHPLSQRTDYTHQPINIVNTHSTYLPNTQSIIQRVATSYGYHTRLDSHLPTKVVPPLSQHILQFLQQQNIRPEQVGFYVIHPGGAKVLQEVEHAFQLPTYTTESGTKALSRIQAPLYHSWQSMKYAGNCSSVSIIDVLKRTQQDSTAEGYGVAFAVGPGICGETLLLHR